MYIYKHIYMYIYIHIYIYVYIYVYIYIYIYVHPLLSTMRMSFVQLNDVLLDYLCHVRPDLLDKYYIIILNCLKNNMVIIFQESLLKAISSVCVSCK